MDMGVMLQITQILIMIDEASGIEKDVMIIAVGLTALKMVEDEYLKEAEYFINQLKEREDDK